MFVLRHKRGGWMKISYPGIPRKVQQGTSFFPWFLIRAYHFELFPDCVEFRSTGVQGLDFRSMLYSFQFWDIPTWEALAWVPRDTNPYIRPWWECISRKSQYQSGWLIKIKKQNQQHRIHYLLRSSCHCVAWTLFSRDVTTRTQWTIDTKNNNQTKQRMIKLINT